MIRKLRAWGADAGQPLGAWIATRLRIAAEEAAALVADGAVYVDGKRLRDVEAPLVSGARIAVHMRVSAKSAAEIRVIFEDADVVVVDKPSGLATQATREAAGALDERVAARFPGAVPLHRLDREASGVVLFARTAEARARLQQALSAGTIERAYAAVAAGHLADDTLTIDRPIGPDPDRSAGGHRRQLAGTPGGERAVTHLRVVRRGVDRTGAAATELEIRLETGRTHQIRAHLAAIAHPILGDPLYAPADVRARAPRLALHAVRISWPGGSAEAPVPDELRLLAD